MPIEKNNYLYDFIRKEGEYKQLFETIKGEYAHKPLPILVSGLCEGASDALYVSLVRDVLDFKKKPVLLI